MPVRSNSLPVDLVLVFRSSSPGPSKQEVRENAQAAQDEYESLVETLRSAGLEATGRKGEKAGQILVLIWCPMLKLMDLARRERHSDFLLGLPVSELPTMDHSFTSSPLSPADRLRLIYDYVTSVISNGGLGIIPGTKQWSRVESLMALHDHEFNDMWIRAWTSRQIGFSIGAGELDKLKDQFGESIALYFSFLSTYTYSLLIIAAIGALFFFLRVPYSAAYSTLLVLWSITFVEYWRVRERRLSVRWGTQGSFRVEKRRAQFEDQQEPVGGGRRFSWWKRDIRILASIPVIMLFAGLLAALLTTIFLIEAFVTQLYTGPGAEYMSFAPTVLFVLLVPRLLSIYHHYAVRLTEWENHSHLSAYEASLTIKTFSLSAIVAYLGLALSAFVYVPFGEYLMSGVQMYVLRGRQVVADQAATLNSTTEAPANTEKNSTWDATPQAHAKLNPSRLQSQMHAYTVTNQVINVFLEIGLPYIMRGVESARSGGKLSSSSSHVNGGKKKRVVFEDEGKGAKEEREFLERVRKEVSLPEYSPFADYAEMVTQFGYVALWSTIWPLAPVMALLNNWLELRSDAFKITQHGRRPIPTRTDTIGPWLESLSFLTWLAVLTNSSLVYLFRPLTQHVLDTTVNADHPHTSIPIRAPRIAALANNASYKDLIVPTILLALVASHAYFFARTLVRHLVDRLVWRDSEEETRAREAEKEVKRQYLKSMGLDREVDRKNLMAIQEGVDGNVKNAGVEGADMSEFWERDDGLEEIMRAVKEA